MRDQDQPFVCYKQGWSMKIVPRGAAGWRAFGIWMASFGLILAAFLGIKAALRDPSAQLAAVGGFALVTAIWAIAMIRWMLARCEVVDLEEMIELKRRRNSDRGRR